MAWSMNEKVSFFLKRGFLLNQDLLEKVNEEFIEKLKYYFNSKNKPIVLTKDLYEAINKENFNFDINWVDFEKARVNFEKGIEKEVYFTFYNLLKDKKEFNKLLEDIKNPVKPKIISDEATSSETIVLKLYQDKNKKVDVQSFVEYYKLRYNYLKKILRSRGNLNDTISINQLKNKRKGDKISIIGLVYSKTITKNKHLLFEIEDITGMMKVICINSKDELYNLAKDVVPDEVIGLRGVIGDGLIFANDIFFPGIPQNEPIKKSSKEEYVAFISDIHFGSNVFLKNDFMKFINWLNGEYGNSEQRKIGKEVKYLFIAGDIVDGVGIYPGQEEDLDIKDISKQYSGFANLLSLIRKDIKIIICPGNHDAVRLAEPQPLFDKNICKELFEMENVILITNPSLVNIGATENFEGFDILVYHGYSFDFYVDYLDNVREGGGYDNIDYLMKLLLQKRHLAPSHTSTLFLVDPEEDYHIIDKVPDFFITGHIHKLKINQYGKTSLICGSCWQAKTAFQEKMGHDPEPGRVPVVNLKTRQTKVMRFIED